VFTPTVAVAETVVVAFKEAGVPAALIFNGTPTEERRTTLANLRAGTIRVVANCTVLTEGFDEPLIEAVVIARPIRSKLLYTQIIGRGTRRDPSKTDCVILDMVGAVRRNDVMTAASLFGLPTSAAETFAQRGLVAAKLELREAESVAGRLEAERVEVFRKRIAELTIRPMRWVAVEPTRGDRFAMNLDESRHIHLAAEDEHGQRWTVEVYTPAPMLNPARRYLRRQPQRQVLASGLDLGYAQGIAEDYVREHGVAAFARADALWVTDGRRASQKSIDFALKLGEHAKPGATQVEVSDMILRAIARREAQAFATPAPKAARKARPVA
jgi:ATP-dependent helicase IRC3